MTLSLACSFHSCLFWRITWTASDYNASNLFKKHLSAESNVKKANLRAFLEKRLYERGFSKKQGDAFPGTKWASCFFSGETFRSVVSPKPNTFWKRRKRAFSVQFALMNCFRCFEKRAFFFCNTKYLFMEGNFWKNSCILLLLAIRVKEDGYQHSFFLRE